MVAEPSQHDARDPDAFRRNGSRASRSRRGERTRTSFVLQVDCEGVYAVPVRLRRRVEAMLLSDRLDRVLAAGVEPESDVLLALRAETLAGAQTRTRLAESVARLLRAADEPDQALSRGPSMAVLPRVRAARPQLEELVARLRASVPVSACGVAQARLLLRDGSGPLFRYEAREDLALLVNRVCAALDPGDRLSL